MPDNNVLILKGFYSVPGMKCGTLPFSEAFCLETKNERRGDSREVFNPAENVFIGDAY
jgi:hypothetical protein